MLSAGLRFIRPQLFKGWITLSTGEIAIQWISVNKTNHAICWIVIYPVYSVIQLLNNLGLVDRAIYLSNNWAQMTQDINKRCCITIF